jgi:phosphopantetheinyl transferase
MTTIALSAHIESPWFAEQHIYWFSQLNSQEAHRYTAMKSKRKQQQMLLSRALIAKALAKFECSLNGAYDIVNYASLILRNTKQTFSISITHSGTMAAIILSDRPIKLGIDIEKIKIRSFTELATEICTTNELTLLNKRDNIEEDFYQLWTIKEALAKASQSALTSLYQCDCSAALMKNVGTIHWQNCIYHFNHITIQGYKGSITTDKKQNLPSKVNHL